MEQAHCTHTIQPQSLAVRPLAATWFGCRALAYGAAVAIATVAVWRERARQRRQLVELSDQMLRDIGLSRSEVRLEVDKPFWRG